MTIEQSTLYLGGEWVKPRSGSTIAVTEASTGRTVGRVAKADRHDVDRAVAAARAAFDQPGGWQHRSPQDRANGLDRLAAALDKRGAEMARRVSIQNGAPISVTTVSEVAFPIELIRYYARMIRTTPDERSAPGYFGGTTTVRHDSMGVVAAIAPWNAPQVLSAFKYAPALAAGCTVVLKPSPETVLDAVLLAEAVADADLPPGVFNVVPADRDVSAYLVSHPDVDRVAFTGSTAAGRAVGEMCGRLLRPVTLELGGKSAAVILDDIDLNEVGLGERLFRAVLANTGQICYLGTRVLVPRSRRDEIVDYLVHMSTGLTIGDALDPATQVGPLVSAAQRNRVERFIERGTAEGGRIVTGGRRPANAGAGWFLEPTIITGLNNDSVLAREEIFGPVLTVIDYDDDTDAVRIANDTEYGLAGSVWTSDPDRGLEVARRVRTGTIGVNGYQVDPAAPFGGVKASGLGRELGPDGLRSYQTVKTIYR